MTAVCPVCGSKSRDGLMDAPCWNALRRDLAAVADLLNDLEIAASRQARLTPPTPGGLASERSPVQWDAAAHAAALSNSLTTWSLDLTGHRFAPRAAALVLIAQHDTVRAHPAAAELWADITGHIARARRAIDQPEHRAIIDVGDCPNDGCRGHLRAYIPHDDAPARVQCNRDLDHEWTADQWLRLGRRLLAAKGPTT